jgi:hypothetical protein
MTTLATSSRPNPQSPPTASPLRVVSHGETKFPPANQQRGKKLFAQCARALKENETVYSLCLRVFRAFQKAGISIAPNHFYWPIPDLAEIERREWPIFDAPPGCDLRLDYQSSFARDVATRFMGECSFAEKPTGDGEYHFNNGFFETVDAEIAYGMIRHYKPSRVIEIGSGFSTRVIAAALKANRERENIASELVTIDPSPERLPQNGFDEFVTYIPQQVQDVDMEIFASLGNGDVLFIDSSHIAGVGSDVVREYLEIIPRLNPGVIVHVHDIFFPSDYPRREVLHNLWFWSEQYLLQAFLSYNSSFEVLWASSAMQFFHPDILENYFPRWNQSYLRMPRATRRFVPSLDNERVWPSSFWMRRK